MRKLSLPRSSVKPACTCRFPGLLCAACEAAALRRYDSPPAAIPDELTEAARQLKACRPALASRVEAALELAMNPHTIQPQYCATVNSCRCPDRTLRGSHTCKHAIAIWLRKQAWPEGGAA